MKCLPEYYFAASRERFTDAVKLRQASRWPIAMYLAGLSVECMIRAFIPKDAPFDERHDVVELMRATEWEVSRKQRPALHSALQDVRRLWTTRFASPMRGAFAPT